jgi:hypothetical protein
MADAISFAIYGKSIQETMVEWREKYKDNIQYERAVLIVYEKEGK